VRASFVGEVADFRKNFIESDQINAEMSEIVIVTEDFFKGFYPEYSKSTLNHPKGKSRDRTFSAML
jgi:hypothetical protein